MNGIMKSVIFLMFMGLLTVMPPGNSEPDIPRGEIPFDTPGEVTEQIALLYSPETGIRANAALKLGDMGARAAPAVPFLVSMLDDERNEAVVDALGRIGEPAVDSLVITLKDKDSVVRTNAAGILALINSPRAVKGLVSALKDDCVDVRRQAAVALGNMRDPRAVDGLCAVLEDEDVMVRRYAASALGKIESPRAVDSLFSTLKKDKDMDVRIISASSLGKIKDFRAIEPLITALAEDETWNVRRVAIASLKKISGENFGHKPEDWRKWWEEYNKKPAEGKEEAVNGGRK